MATMRSKLVERPLPPDARGVSRSHRVTRHPASTRLAAQIPGAAPLRGPVSHPRGGLALARLGGNAGVRQVGHQPSSRASRRRNHHMAQFRGAPVDYCPLYPGCDARLRGVSAVLMAKGLAACTECNP